MDKSDERMWNFIKELESIKKIIILRLKNTVSEIDIIG